MSTITPESFLEGLREGLALSNQLNEDTSPDKPLQAIIEKCLKVIDESLFQVSICFEKIGLEILEVNQGRPVNEQWLNEAVNMEAEHKKIDVYLSRSSMYAERAGNIMKNKSGEYVQFNEFQMKEVCSTNDNYIYMPGKSIHLFVDSGIWLKPNQDPQYSTQLYREKYINLVETVKKVYVMMIALLNKYYEIKKLDNKTMEIIPATKNICGKMLIENATGKTLTNPPFITESMFNTGKG